MSIKENLHRIQNEIEGTGVKLVAVTKTKPVSDLWEAYEGGCMIMGENKVQEMVDKYDQLPKNIEWHMIGHVQSNKVKYMAGFVHLIHGVDSLALLEEINKRAFQQGRIQSCLLQVHIAQEDTKFGFDPSELVAFLGNPNLSKLKHVSIAGLMGMATYTDQTEQIRMEFRGLKELFDKIRDNIELENVQMKELSMGMSGDYPIAIEEGSTLIRVGSKIFGERNYLN